MKLGLAKLDQNNIKFGVFVLILSFFFVIRWTSPQAGYPSEGSDAANHFLIAEEIGTGSLFPAWNATSTSIHTVSRFLPIYSGIVLPHLLALSLKFIFHVPLTIAMLIWNDLAILLCFMGLYIILRSKRAHYTEHLAIYLLQGLLLSFMMSVGFYSQIFGMGVGIMSVALFEKSPKISTTLSIISIFLYPDFALWCLPFFMLRAYQQTRWPLLIATGILWLALLGVLIARIPVPGGVNVEYASAFLVAGLLLKYHSRLTRFQTVLIFSITLISSLVALISYLEIGHLSYYAKKSLFWSPLCLACLVPMISKKEFSALIFLLFFGIFIWDKDVNIEMLRHIVEAKGFISADEERALRQAVKSSNCRSFAYIRDGLSKNHPWIFTIGNALTGRCEFANQSIDLTDLGYKPLALNQITEANDFLVQLKKKDLVTVGPLRIACPDEP